MCKVEERRRKKNMAMTETVVYENPDSVEKTSYGTTGEECVSMNALISNTIR